MAEGLAHQPNLWLIFAPLNNSYVFLKDKKNIDNQIQSSAHYRQSDVVFISFYGMSVDNTEDALYGTNYTLIAEGLWSKSNRLESKIFRLFFMLHVPTMTIDAI